MIDRSNAAPASYLDGAGIGGLRETLDQREVGALTTRSMKTANPPMAKRAVRLTPRNVASASRNSFITVLPRRLRSSYQLLRTPPATHEMTCTQRRSARWRISGSTSRFRSLASRGQRKSGGEEVHTAFSATGAGSVSPSPEPVTEMAAALELRGRPRGRVGIASGSTGVSVQFPLPRHRPSPARG